MIEQIKMLFEKYNFDYIRINPKDLHKIDWEFIPEELFIDVKNKPGYLGSININNHIVEVFYDREIEIGNILFKYDNIQKERKYKLNNLLKEKE